MRDSQIQIQSQKPQKTHKAKMKQELENSRRRGGVGFDSAAAAKWVGSWKDGRMTADDAENSDDKPT
jgi:hypothetical protein